MRVLIVGGTNFIGPHVVNALDRLGAQITVCHRGLQAPESGDPGASEYAAEDAVLSS